jgi:hypothetical protein
MLLRYSHEDEVRVLEAAVELGRSVPKVCALMSAYHRASEEIFRIAKFNVDPSVEQDNPQLKEQNDSLLKLNYQYWLEYSWLKEQDNFDMDKVSTHE